MIAFIARRILLAGVSVWVMSVMAFTIIQLPPGDQVDAYIAKLESGDQHAIFSGGEIGRREAAALREYLGMGRSRQ